MKTPKEKAKELVEKYLNEFEIFGLKTPCNIHKYNKAIMV